MAAIQGSSLADCTSPLDFLTPLLDQLQFPYPSLRGLAMLRIQLLGSFQVSDDEKPLAKLQSDRLQALLAYLVLQRAQPLARQQLAVTFWPDTTDAQARTNLRTLLARLREALPNADQFLTVDVQTVQWRTASPFTLDVLDFEQALAANRLTDATALYRGDLLPGCYDDWITGDRERLRQAFQRALEQLIERAEQQYHYEQAILYARRLLRHDPLHETTYRHLMRLQLSSGDRSGALRTYHACAAMLRDELGVEPTSETRTLHAQLLKVDEPVVEAPAEPTRVLFVGRQAEWSHLLTTWRTTLAGRPQLVLITGEAGVGKTHLAEHLLAHLERQGVTTITARSYATERNTAYAPIGQWLRTDALRERLSTLDQVWLVEVSRLAPWLHTDRPELPSPGPLTEAWQRQRLFEALARALLIRHEPLLLLLDDVQWCDRETLDWLHYMLQFEATAPLLIVATLRQEEAGDNEALATVRLLLQKSERLSEISLARFDVPTTTVLAASLSEDDLPTAEAARIYRETEGNPLFVVEMMRAGRRMDDRAIVTFDQVLPPKVQATIQYRLSQLSANAQSLVQIAAVIGREFTFEVLARASDVGEDALVQGLDELWRKHIVREQDVSAYDFSHDKIRVVAYAALSVTRRRMLHRKVAEALVSVHAASLEAQSGSIARHYEIAGQADRATEFYRRAAQAAQRIYANEEAIGYYQHLLENDLTSYVSPEDMCGIKLALGEIWRLTGRWAQAEAIESEALAQAEELNDVVSQAQAQQVLADVMRLRGRYDEALGWLAKAQEGFERTSNQAGLSRTLWTMGEIYWYQGDHDPALVTLNRQLDIATRIGDQRGMCEALGSLGMIHWSQGDLDQSQDCCERSITMAKAIGHRQALGRAANILGNIGLAQRSYTFAFKWYQVFYEVAREVGDRQGLAWALHAAAHVFAGQGDFQRAVAYNRQAWPILVEIGDTWSMSVGINDIGWMLKRLDYPRQAEELHRLAIALGKKLGMPGFLSDMSHDLAELLLEQRRLDEADAVYREAQASAASVKGDWLAGEDVRFNLSVLGVRLRHAQGHLTQPQAVAELDHLLGEWPSPEQQAKLHYGIWRIDSLLESYRIKATVQFHALAASTSSYQYRQRYHELTGEWLPAPDPLPDLPGVVVQVPVNVEALMTQLRAVATNLLLNSS
jgi:DNA-binding SARP family transcriptional activator/tetratricopeptide (TPR) repeat protein